MSLSDSDVRPRDPPERDGRVSTKGAPDLRERCPLRLLAAAAEPAVPLRCALQGGTAGAARVGHCSPLHSWGRRRRSASPRVWHSGLMTSDRGTPPTSASVLSFLRQESQQPHHRWRQRLRSHCSVLGSAHSTPCSRAGPQGAGRVRVECWERHRQALLGHPRLVGFAGRPALRDSRALV